MKRPQDYGVPASRLCWPCYSGDHSQRHSQIGCLQGIGPRQDYICRCDILGDYRPRKSATVIAHHSQRINWAW